MKFNKKTDERIMNVLGISEIRHSILQTNKGELSFAIRKGEDYIFILDAVPLLKETSDELKEILFPITQEFNGIVKNATVTVTHANTKTEKGSRVPHKKRNSGQSA